MKRAFPEVINSPVIVLVGPTAIGKTALSFEIAREFDCEIISMDSMQVYWFMDIGTAKPTAEERQQVPHHLIDIIQPDEQYNAARFVKDCLRAVQKIVRTGKIPLITGGTGLYLSSLVKGLFEEVNVKDEVKERLHLQFADQGLVELYQELRHVDPVSASRIHSNDKHRILRGLEIYYSSGIPWSEHLQQQRNTEPPMRFSQLVEVGLTCERPELHRRIEARSSAMLDQGLVAEVEKLRAMGFSPALSSMGSIGYRHVNRFLDGHCNQSEMKETLIRDTKRYAKRQMTWFRRHDSLCWYQRDRAENVILDIYKKITF